MRTLSIVLLFTLSAAAQPYPGEERAVSAYRASARAGHKWEGAAAGGPNGFLATWFEWSDVPRLFGARLTPEGKLAGAPFVIGVPPWMPVAVRAEGDRYIVTVDEYSHYYQKTWEVSDHGVFDLGFLHQDNDDPVENANGEHLAVTWEGQDFTITFVDRSGRLTVRRSARAKFGTPHR